MSEGSPKIRGVVDRSEKRDTAVKVRSSPGKSICLPSYAQAVTNDLENVSERGTFYKRQIIDPFHFKV